MIAYLVKFLRDEVGATPFEFGLISAVASVVVIHGLYLLFGSS